MADKLDDFFAKKDKSRKSKVKNITTEDMAKTLEESGKRSEKLKKLKDKTSNTNMNPILNNQEADEEWLELEEDREKDYSGLKITTLNIKDKEEEFREQQKQDMEDEKQKDGQLGPWKVATPGTDTESEADKNEEININDVVVTPIPVAAAAATQGGRYVPPHLRNQSQTSSTNTSLNPISLSSTRRPKGGAPKIGDIVEFPTLGAIDTNEDNKGFQTVKSGNTRDLVNKNSANVTLDNKYGLLTKALQNSD
ncbi:protein CDV3 homolog [Oppia nitens]|uniref:protein CDV3 homolog n=1 Tax=Oppia nitens TaxID=1686743 RepID=UPI0023DBCDD3|nr:protein CDV3 homolog [Oppia nitens]